jgi:hypothetical protein
LVEFQKTFKTLLKLKKQENELYKEKLLVNTIIVPENNKLVEANSELSEILNKRYGKSVKSSEFKFKNESREKFKKAIVTENLDVFVHLITPSAMVSIEELRNSIDISDYDRKSVHYKRDEEAETAKRVYQESKEEKMSEAEIKRRAVFDTPKKEEPKPKPIKKKTVKKEEPAPVEDESSVDDLIKECFNDKKEKDIIAASFKKMKAEQSKTPVKTNRSSVSKHKKAIKGKYNDEITELLFDNYDDDFKYNTDELTDEIYNDLICNKRGSVADTAIWASQNKEAGKKAITAVIKKINKGLVEEQL